MNGAHSTEFRIAWSIRRNTSALKAGDPPRNASGPDAGMPSVSDFEERNRGLWPSFRAFAQEYADDCGLFYQVPEQFATYFDLDKWVWDLEQEFTVVDGLDGVFVFHNL